MTNIKYQNYKHFKLPITIDPLKYGKLIFNQDNNFIIQINRTNVALIKEWQEFNLIKIFHKGDLAFVYKDLKISDLEFSRLIQNEKFTFKNNKLISTEKTFSLFINKKLFKS
jgi:hypothetical protein